MAFPPYRIPTATAFDGLVSYPIGVRIGGDTATDVWGATGGGMPIGDITPYSPTGRGPLGGQTIWRKDITHPDHWVAAQMIVPFDSYQSAVGARVSPDGSGYFVADYTSTEGTIGGLSYFKKLQAAQIIGSPPPNPTAIVEGNYYYDPAVQAQPNGGYLYTETQLVRVNHDGTVDPLAVIGTGPANAYLFDNEDATFWMIEVVGDNPVQIRVGILYRIAAQVATPLPGSAYGFNELFTYTDSSPKRLTSGSPGAKGTGSSAGTFWGFNAGYMLSVLAGDVSGGSCAVTVYRPHDAAVTVDAGSATAGAITWVGDVGTCTVSSLPPGTTTITAAAGSESASVEVDTGAQPHTLRATAGGTPVTVTLSPGADAVEAVTATAGGAVVVRGRLAPAGASVTTSGGAASVRGVRSVPGAASSSGAGAVALKGALQLSGASVTTSAGSIAITASLPGHRLRATSLGGAPAVVALVPGADAAEARVTPAAGAVAIGAQLPVPGASATTSGVQVGLWTGVPESTATTSAGAVSLSGRISVAGATTTTAAESVGIQAATYLLVPGATLTAGAGAVAIGAQLPIAGASAATSASLVPIRSGLALEVVGASVTTTAGPANITAVAPVAGASVATWGVLVGISGAGYVLPDTDQPIHAKQIPIVLVATRVPVALVSRSTPIVGRPRMASVVYIGDDKPFRFPIPTDLDLELAGAVFYCDVVASGGSTKIPADQTTVDTTEGVAWAWFLSATTAALTAGASYSGDGVLKLADGHRHTIGTIGFRAAARVTPTP